MLNEISSVIFLVIVLLHSAKSFLTFTKEVFPLLELMNSEMKIDTKAGIVLTGKRRKQVLLQFTQDRFVEEAKECLLNITGGTLLIYISLIILQLILQ